MDMSNNYHVAFDDHVDHFAVHSDYFIIKTCLSVCGETTIYSTVMGDVLVEREFNYLLYGILHVQMG